MSKCSIIHRLHRFGTYNLRNLCNLWIYQRSRLGAVNPPYRSWIRNLLGLLAVLTAVLLLCTTTPTLAARPYQAPPRISELILGTSSQGRAITALKIGDGPRKFALVGDTHG